MATAHWTSNSIAAALPTDNTPVHQTVNFPANATIKKALLRQCALRARDVELSGPSVTPMFIHTDLNFLTGAYAGRNIFTTDLWVPWTVTVFLATAISTYNAWYTAGDHEIGFNQRMSYGGNGKPASTLDWVWFLDVPAGSFTWVGGIKMELRFLYTLP